MATEIIGTITVISDVGATANSYVSVAETKSLWELDPYKNDYAYTDEQIARGVIAATSMIDNTYGQSLYGKLFDETYALFFPRKNITDARGVEITDMTIFPVDIRKATATQAYYVCERNRLAETTVSGVKRQKMDGLGEQEFFNPAQQQAARPLPIHEETQMIMQPYTSYSRYSIALNRG